MGKSLNQFWGGSLPVWLTLTCLLPFLGKAYHIDDTLFLKVAEHLQQSPFDFYGFSVNWYGYVQPMSEITKNPPLASYYLALVAALFGWQEWVLHLAFILPAIGVTLGTYRLAQGLRVTNPQHAALFALCTPVFLVSATNVMSDIMMLAFYVWAIVCWVRGIDRREFRYLFVAGLCGAVAILCKYFAISLIPLLLIYTIFGKVPSKFKLKALAILSLPVLIMFGYEIMTKNMYGSGLIASGLTYSIKGASGEWGRLLNQAQVGLAFAGGGLAPIGFLAPFLWPRRAWVIGGLVLAGIFGVLVLNGSFADLDLVDGGRVRWLPVVQVTLFVFAGLHLLTIAVVEFFQERDSTSVLLVCWILGTFVFAAFLNWTINGRVLLPIVPAMAILAARRLGRRSASKRPVLSFVVIPSLVLCLVVAWGDYRLANAQRDAVTMIEGDLQGTGEDVWFQGHWGFQYYMEQAGARPFDVRDPQVRLGDFLVVPTNNTNFFAVDPSYVYLKSYLVPACRWVSTMSLNPVGAGFYASESAPLPYVFGQIPQEEYLLFQKRY